MNQHLRKLLQNNKACTRCDLRKSCSRVVVGKEIDLCDIMIVGEAPGYYEDQQGKPFVGRCGQLLDKHLKEAGIDRNKVYIDNVVNCRPPKNRVPKQSEVDACKDWLYLKIMILKPKSIITLGKTPTFFFLDIPLNSRKDKMKDYVGKNFEWKSGPEPAIIFPMYHPSYLLRCSEWTCKVQVEWLKKVINEHNYSIRF